jgi:hypothetical protein
VNEDADFWNGIGGGLQSATFVALGRIFDDDARTHSAQQVLRRARDYPGIFSAKALEARKVEAGLAAQDAATYAAAAYIPPKTGGFAQLQAALDDKQKFYRTKIKKIRDEVFAHAVALSPEERSAMFAGVFLRQFWELAVFPLQLHEALWQLYANGRKPELQPCYTTIQDILANLPAKGTISMEHMHTARETRGFLDRLRPLVNPAPNT